MISQGAGPPKRDVAGQDTTMAHLRKRRKGALRVTLPSALATVNKGCWWQALLAILACFFTTILAHDEGSSTVPHQTLPDSIPVLSRLQPDLLLFQNLTNGTLVKPNQDLLNCTTERQTDSSTARSSLVHVVKATGQLYLPEDNGLDARRTDSGISAAATGASRKLAASAAKTLVAQMLLTKTAVFSQIPSLLADVGSSHSEMSMTGPTPTAELFKPSLDSASLTAHLSPASYLKEEVAIESLPSEEWALSKASQSSATTMASTPGLDQIATKSSSTIIPAPPVGEVWQPSRSKKETSHSVLLITSPFVPTDPAAASMQDTWTTETNFLDGISAVIASSPSLPGEIVGNPRSASPTHLSSMVGRGPTDLAQSNSVPETQPGSLIPSPAAKERTVDSADSVVVLDQEPLPTELAHKLATTTTHLPASTSQSTNLPPATAPVATLLSAKLMADTMSSASLQMGDLTHFSEPPPPRSVMLLNAAEGSTEGADSEEKAATARLSRAWLTKVTTTRWPMQPEWAGAAEESSIPTDVLVLPLAATLADLPHAGSVEASMEAPSLHDARMDLLPTLSGDNKRALTLTTSLPSSKMPVDIIPNSLLAVTPEPPTLPVICQVVTSPLPPAEAAVSCAPHLTRAVAEASTPDAAEMPKFSTVTGEHPSGPRELGTGPPTTESYLPMEHLDYKLEDQTPMWLGTSPGSTALSAQVLDLGPGGEHLAYEAEDNTAMLTGTSSDLTTPLGQMLDLGPAGVQTGSPRPVLAHASNSLTVVPSTWAQVGVSGSGGTLAGIIWTLMHTAVLNERSAVSAVSPAVGALPKETTSHSPYHMLPVSKNTKTESSLFACYPRPSAGTSEVSTSANATSATPYSELAGDAMFSEEEQMPAAVKAVTAFPTAASELLGPSTDLASSSAEPQAPLRQRPYALGAGLRTPTMPVGSTSSRSPSSLLGVSSIPSMPVKMLPNALEELFSVPLPSRMSRHASSITVTATDAPLLQGHTLGSTGRILLTDFTAARTEPILGPATTVGALTDLSSVIPPEWDHHLVGHLSMALTSPKAKELQSTSTTPAQSSTAAGPSKTGRRAATQTVGSRVTDAFLAVMKNVTVLSRTSSPTASSVPEALLVTAFPSKSTDGLAQSLPRQAYHLHLNAAVTNVAASSTWKPTLATLREHKVVDVPAKPVSPSMSISISSPVLTAEVATTMHMESKAQPVKSVTAGAAVPTSALFTSTSLTQSSSSRAPTSETLSKAKPVAVASYPSPSSVLPVSPAIALTGVSVHTGPSMQLPVTLPTTASEPTSWTNCTETFCNRTTVPAWPAIHPTLAVSTHLLPTSPPPSTAKREPRILKRTMAARWNVTTEMSKQAGATEIGPTSKQPVVQKHPPTLSWSTEGGSQPTSSVQETAVRAFPLQFCLTGITYTQFLESKSSRTYKKLEREVMLTLNKMFSTYENFLQTSILKFVNGSVIVKSEVLFQGDGPAPTNSDLIRTLLTGVEKEMDTFFDWRVDVQSIQSNGFSVKNLEPEKLSISLVALRLGSAVFGDVAGTGYLYRLKNEVIQSLGALYQVRNLSLVRLRNVRGDLEVRGEVYIDTRAHADVGQVLQALKGLANLSVDLTSLSVDGSRLSLQVFPISFMITNKMLKEELVDHSSVEHQAVTRDLAAVLMHALRAYSTLLQVVIRDVLSGSLMCHGDVIFQPSAPSSMDVLKTLVDSVGPNDALAGSHFQVDPYSFIVADSQMEPPLVHPSFPGYGVAIVVCTLVVLVVILSLLCLKPKVFGWHDQIKIGSRRDPEAGMQTFEMDRPGFLSTTPEGHGRHSYALGKQSTRD
ncbi:PREDICTED: mucin-17-like [Gavialis gangeticus]|uniref:mucin-17-like n=1 Tax=Gavialis gangeticus TaxID=94835 RepID=UPI00092E3B88|nr:PREDICTED: mucin-17-like [Gavialis gangeticus]